jgi:transcriptional regulator with XRE-family HTH domain
MDRHKYQPHYQLKTIRKTLKKTQKQFAEMLGVSYPYFLSVETGQRAMSEALARKIGWLVGVSSASLLNDKKAKPMSFDETSNTLVPFSLQTYKQHRAQFPKFPLPDTGKEVTPSLEGYAKIFHAVLDSAMSTHRLGQVLPNFLLFFAHSISSGTAVGAFHASLQKLYPEDPDAARAAIALLERTYIPPTNLQRDEKTRIDE